MSHQLSAWFWQTKQERMPSSCCFSSECQSKSKGCLCACEIYIYIYVCVSVSWLHKWHSHHGTDRQTSKNITGKLQQTAYLYSVSRRSFLLLLPCGLFTGASCPFVLVYHPLLLLLLPSVSFPTLSCEAELLVVSEATARLTLAHLLQTICRPWKGSKGNLKLQKSLSPWS